MAKETKIYISPSYWTTQRPESAEQGSISSIIYRTIDTINSQIKEENTNIESKKEEEGNWWNFYNGTEKVSNQQGKDDREHTAAIVDKMKIGFNMLFTPVIQQISGLSLVPMTRQGISVVFRNYDASTRKVTLQLTHEYKESTTSRKKEGQVEVVCILDPGGRTYSIEKFEYAISSKILSTQLKEKGFQSFQDLEGNSCYWIGPTPEDMKLYVTAEASSSTSTILRKMTSDERRKSRQSLDQLGQFKIYISRIIDRINAKEGIPKDLVQENLFKSLTSYRSAMLTIDTNLAVTCQCLKEANNFFKQVIADIVQPEEIRKYWLSQVEENFEKIPDEKFPSIVHYLNRENEEHPLTSIFGHERVDEALRKIETGEVVIEKVEELNIIPRSVTPGGTISLLDDPAIQDVRGVKQRVHGKIALIQEKIEKIKTRSQQKGLSEEFRKEFDRLAGVFDGKLVAFYQSCTQVSVMTDHIQEMSTSLKSGELEKFQKEKKKKEEQLQQVKSSADETIKMGEQEVLGYPQRYLEEKKKLIQEEVKQLTADLENLSTKVKEASSSQDSFFVESTFKRAYNQLNEAILHEPSEQISDRRKSLNDYYGIDFTLKTTVDKIFTFEGFQQEIIRLSTILSQYSVKFTKRTAKKGQLRTEIRNLSQQLDKKITEHFDLARKKSIQESAKNRLERRLVLRNNCKFTDDSVQEIIRELPKFCLEQYNKNRWFGRCKTVDDLLKREAEESPGKLRRVFEILFFPLNIGTRRKRRNLWMKDCKELEAEDLVTLKTRWIELKGILSCPKYVSYRSGDLSIKQEFVGILSQIEEKVDSWKKRTKNEEMKSKVRLLLERYCTVCENYDSQSPILSEIKKYEQAILQNARNLTANEIEQATLKSQAVEKKKLLKQLIEDIVIPDISEGSSESLTDEDISCRLSCRRHSVPFS